VTGFSWWNVVPSTIGGLIGGSFAVIGMVVSGRRERIKDRERRTQEAIRSMQQCLLAVEDLCGTDTDTDDPGSLTAVGYDRQERLISQLRVHVASIPDQKARQSLERISRMLSYPGIGAPQGYSDVHASHDICNYGLKLAAHYLAGEVTPAVPDSVRAYLDQLTARE
jgi:hypothetical protein